MRGETTGGQPPDVPPLHPDPQCPGPNAIKLFTAVIHESLKKATALVSYGFFQPSPRFVSRPKVTRVKHHSGAHFRVGSWLERPARDKRSSLLRPFVNYDHKKSYHFGARGKPASAQFGFDRLEVGGVGVDRRRRNGVSRHAAERRQIVEDPATQNRRRRVDVPENVSKYRRSHRTGTDATITFCRR